MFDRDRATSLEKLMVPAALPFGFPSPAEVGVIEIQRYPAYRAGTYIHPGD